MAYDDTEQELRNALEKFETAINTPLVAGELRSWSQELGQSWQRVVTLLEPHVQHTHQRLIKQIAAEDPDLLSRVTQLEADDQEIIQALQSLQLKVSKLGTAGQEPEPNETKVRGDVEQVVQLGSQFVAKVRKQEVALATWHTEAFHRDRGVGD